MGGARASLSLVYYLKTNSRDLVMAPMSGDALNLYSKHLLYSIYEVIPKARQSAIHSWKTFKTQDLHAICLGHLRFILHGHPLLSPLTTIFSRPNTATTFMNVKE